MLAAQGVFVTGSASAFAMGRVVAGECELLTLAVRPHLRRQGLGQAALTAYEAAATASGAADSFLEVAANNAAAIALYRAFGYGESGRRPGYYRLPTGKKCDALVFSKPLSPT